MTTAKQAHPTADDLTAFAIGKLDDARTNAVAAHLEECEPCRIAVENAPDDEFAKRVRAADRSASVASFSVGLLDDPAPAASDDVVPPELVDHPRYRIIRRIGQGGMGVVYLAHHKVMDDPRAIKIISRSLIEHPDGLARFHREVKAAAKLKHPNIAAAYDAEQFGNLHTLVMEFVEGKSLDKVLEKKGRLPLVYACGYIRQAALGLQHAFEQGMVHRDIKPQNLMLTPKGQIKLLDFGLARLASEQTRGRQLTADGAYMGTPEFMAPEQATDARTADIRADIYSLGCTLFCLLTGQPPFQEDTPVKMALAHINRDAPVLSDFRTDASTKLVAILAKMLAKNPSDRYQTPAEVAKALLPFCKADAKPVEPPKVGTSVAHDTQIPVALPAQVGEPQLGGGPSVFRAASLRRLGGLLGLSGMLNPSAAININPDELNRRRRRPNSQSWWFWGGVLAALMTVIGLLFATVVAAILLLRTKDGVIEITGLPADAEVLVDDTKTTVTMVDGTKAEIRVKPGVPHKVEVKANGVVVQGEKVTVASGGRQPLTIRAVVDAKPKAPTVLGNQKPKPFTAADVHANGKDQIALNLSETTKLTLARIPAGKFWLGSPNNEPEREKFEDQREMKIPKDFYLGIHEVTQAQWKAVMGPDHNPSKFKGDDLPVETVSWDEVQMFLKKLNEKTKGNGFLHRLPTGAEWEYACRGGDNGKDSKPFYFKDGPTSTISPDKANYNGNLPYPGGAVGKFRARTAPVGTFEPNRYGLYDMHGNVWEMCDGVFPPGGTGYESRGGSWTDNGATCRAAHRGGGSPP